MSEHHQSQNAATGTGLPQPATSPAVQATLSTAIETAADKWVNDHVSPALGEKTGHLKSLLPHLRDGIVHEFNRLLSPKEPAAAHPAEGAQQPRA
jgi:hypothetical protein